MEQSALLVASYSIRAHVLCLFTYSKIINTSLGRKELYNSISADIHNASDVDHTKMRAKKMI